MVSSADLIQICLSSWDEAALASHRKAAQAVDEARRRPSISYVANWPGPVRPELAVQQFILQRFAQYGVETDHGPVVGVNAHSGDPHYTPDAGSSWVIARGDWVLIDLWARLPQAGSVFADSTWVAIAGDRVPPQHRRIFDIVRQARDLVIKRAGAD